MIIPTMMISWAYSVTIFSKEEQLIKIVQEKHPLLALLLQSCKKKEEDSYETSYYPIYLMVKKYFEILDINFLKIVYNK